MNNEQLIQAAAVLVGGLLVAGLLALVVRRTLAARKTPAIARSSGDAASLTFWVVLAAAVAVAIGLLSPGALNPVPALMLSYLPRILSAGLILIGGRAVAAVLGRFVVRATERAAVSSSTLESAVRGTVIGLAIVLALAQLGIDTAILLILVGGLTAALALSFGLMTGLGARDVASNIAAGRVLRRLIASDTELRSDGVAGRVVALGPALVSLRLDNGTEKHVPYRQLLDSGFEVGGDA